MGSLWDFVPVSPMKNLKTDARWGRPRTAEFLSRCQKLANGCFANGYFETLWKVPRRPSLRERKGVKRLDPSGKNRRPANSLKDVRLSCGLELKVPVYKVPICQPSSFTYTLDTIDTEIPAKRNNMISESITFRITKLKAKLKFGVRYLCGPECENHLSKLRSIGKWKRTNILGELISL